MISALILGITFQTSLFLSNTIALPFAVYWWCLVGRLMSLNLRAIHQAGRVLMFLPNNFPKFLEFATELVLLHRVGGGYIFIHRYLLEYSAELQVPENT